MKTKMMMDFSNVQLATLEVSHWYQYSQTPRNETQSICATQRTSQESPVPTGPQAVYNGVTCFNEIKEPENNTSYNFLQDVFNLETELLNRTSCVVPQTMSHDRAPNEAFTRWKTEFPDYFPDANWCNNQAFNLKTGATDYQVVPHKRPRKFKRNRGPKPKIMYDGKGPIQLWQLILSLLVSTSSPTERLVEWTRERKYEFRILQPDKLATLWGEHKKKPSMTFEKLARGLRYYYGKSILEKVRGKQYTYMFVMDIAAILGFDPMDEIPEGVRRDEAFAFSGATSTAGSQQDEFHVSESVGQGEGLRGPMEGCRGAGEGVWGRCEDSVDGRAQFRGTIKGSGDTGAGFWGSGECFVDAMEGLEGTGERFEGTREVIGGTMEGLEGTLEENSGVTQVFGGGEEEFLASQEGFWEMRGGCRNVTEGFGGLTVEIGGIRESFRGSEEGFSATREGFWEMRGACSGVTEGFGGITEGMGGFGDREAGFPGIKSFDFSVLVEPNETSSFYEAL